MSKVAAAVLMAALCATPALALCNTSGTYINVDGHVVETPRCKENNDAGAHYVCRDGSFSHAEHRNGACSHHGGVDHDL